VHDRLEGAPKTGADVTGPGRMVILSGVKTLLETGPLASADWVDSRCGDRRD
jgi:hypothetical protein